MKFFLVLLRCSLDDLPLRLFDDSAGYQERIDAFVASVSAATITGVEDVFGLDVSEPFHVTLVTFEGGLPVKTEIVRDLKGVW